MKMKTLLLGTAAAFAVSGGAQAADLALAVEPIDYVKVCDAFGTGYYYIPGTDTCLKIGGYVQLDVWFYDDDKVGNITGSYTDGTGGNEPVVYDKDSYSASWEFKSEAGVHFTAKSMSDLGPIVAFAEFRAISNNDDWKGTNADVKNAYADKFYGSIGPILFGYTGSTADLPGGFTYDGAGKRSDRKVDQVRLSYMMGTWGIMLGLEDPRDRFEPGIDGNKNASGDYPDIVLALTGGLGGVDLKVFGAIHDTADGDTGWGVGASATVDLGAAAKLRFGGSYSDNAKTYADGTSCSYADGSPVCDDGKWWSAMVSGQVALSSNLAAAASASWLTGDGGASYAQTNSMEAAFGIYYYPSGNSEIGLEALYTDPDTGTSGDDGWGIHGRLKTHY